MLPRMVLVLALVTLIWIPKVGDRAVYKMADTIHAGGHTLTIDGTLTETVSEVKDGRVLLAQSIAGTGTLSGRPPAALPPLPRKATYRSDGTLLDVRFEGLIEGERYRIDRLTQLVLPKAPLAVGGAWTVEQPSDPKAADTGLKVVYTLGGEERVGGRDAWKIVAKGGETGDDGGAVEATFWIDGATGARLHVHAKITGMVVPGAEGSTEIEADLLRQL